jgi:NitT/TauT family transport system substrate-binding protein
MIGRRTFALLALAALATTSCKRSTPSESSSGKPFTLVLNWVPEPEFGGFYAAQASGAFTSAGLNVTLKPGGPGVPSLQMVATGQADAGITGADELLLARERGADVVPVFAVYQHNPQAIMTKAERGAQTIADVLAKGTLAIEPGLPYVKFLSRKFGFDKVQVTTYDGGIARFLIENDYAQQCYLTSEPLAAKRKGVATKVFPISDAGYDPYGAVVIVKRDTLEKDPQRVAAFVKAAQAGWAQYLANPSAANEAMHKLNTSMDLETFAEAAEAQKPLIETAETKANGLGSMSKARWNDLRETLAALDFLKKPVSFEGWSLY